jgi:beta-N-acetylhexosaminidase
MHNYGSIVLDIAGYELSAEDTDLLSHPEVLGLILFARNFHSRAQLGALISSVYRVKPNCMVMVDHEGGKVQRFLTDFTRLPPASSYGDLFDTAGEEAAITKLLVDQALAAKELLSVGVNINLGPLLDLDVGHSSVMNGRCYHNLASVVTILSGAAINAAQAEGLFVTAKHFPGHGWATADSHTDLPYDSRDLAEIVAADLVPFMAHISKYDLLMPAHIIFSKVDSLPVTFSKIWLQHYLRDIYSYKGVIISDDLSMAASRSFGSLAECGALALEAGCDIALMCNDRVGVCEALDYISRTRSKPSSEFLHNFIVRLQKKLAQEFACPQ